MQSYIKTLGIFAVMAIHLMTMVFREHPIFDFYLTIEVAFRAFVPTFFFLAGYNYARTTLSSWQSQKSYILYLLTNLFIWSIVYLIFGIVTSAKGLSARDLVLAFNGYAFPGQYFLVALALLAMASLGMSSTVTSVVRRFAILQLLWLTLFFIPIPGNFSTLEIRLPFIWSFDFFLGAMMGLAGRRFHVWSSIALVLCLPISFLFGGNTENYLSPHVHVLGTLVGAVVALTPDSKAHPSIDFLGRNTLPLYLAHPLAILAIFHCQPSLDAKPFYFIFFFLLGTAAIAFVMHGKRKKAISCLVQGLSKAT